MFKSVKPLAGTVLILSLILLNACATIPVEKRPQVRKELLSVADEVLAEFFATDPAVEAAFHKSVGYFVCRKRFLTVLCLLTICLCMALQITTGHAESAKLPEEPKQEDPEKKKGTKSGGRILPIPIFLTEPAFGYGLGVALGYIHPAKDDTEKQEESSLHTLGSVSAERSAQKPPPT
ncbi:MAG: hypothetical protein JSV60_07125, partial [Desulfobacterales bacterium]